MKKNIPEIDEILDGVNNPDKVLNHENDETSPETVNSEPEDSNKCWDTFLSFLNEDNDSSDKEERLVCKIDRDLADSLDDCDISNKCRSDLVNAIIRSFFKTYINRLVKYRREKKSLFQNFNAE